MTDWQGVLLIAGVLLAQGLGLFLVMNLLARRAKRREAIDLEAHEAYMSGGGYPAYNEVYRKHGMVPKGGFK